MRIFIALIALAFTFSTFAGDKHYKEHHGKHHGDMMFKKMDTNEDGAISVEEHEAALERSAEKRREHFVNSDTDGDGMLTREEARAAYKAKKKERKEKRKEKREENDKDE